MLLLYNDKHSHEVCSICEPSAPIKRSRCKTEGSTAAIKISGRIFCTSITMLALNT